MIQIKSAIPFSGNLFKRFLILDQLVGDDSIAFFIGNP